MYYIEHLGSNYLLGCFGMENHLSSFHFPASKIMSKFLAGSRQTNFYFPEFLCFSRELASTIILQNGENFKEGSSEYGARGGGVVSEKPLQQW